MKFKILTSITSLTVFLFALCVQGFGQDGVPPQIKPNAVSSVSPQKRTVIKELLEVTEAAKLAESTSQTMLVQMEQEFPKIMEMLMTQQAADNKLTPAQLKALQSESSAASMRMLKRFQEKVLTAINFAELLETVSLELYDKYFTEEELKDIVAFYRTSTGKKSIQVMPKLVADTMQMSNQVLLPKIMGALDEIIQEEAKRIK